MKLRFWKRAKVKARRRSAKPRESFETSRVVAELSVISTALSRIADRLDDISAADGKSIRVALPKPIYIANEGAIDVRFDRDHAAVRAIESMTERLASALCEVPVRGHVSVSVPKMQPIVDSAQRKAARNGRA